MRNYRVTYIGDAIKFAIWVDANHEADAMDEARRRHPHFTVLEVVEVFPPADPCKEMEDAL